MDKRNQRSLICAMALLILCITGAIFVFVFTSINELSLSKFHDRSYVLYSDKGNEYRAMADKLRKEVVNEIFNSVNTKQ